MSTQYESVAVKCPYFLQLDERAIKCKGMERGSTIKYSMLSNKQRDRYLDQYCKGIRACECCEIYKMLARSDVR